MIRVGLDGTCLRQPRTGVGTYTYSLVSHLLEQDVSLRIIDGGRRTTISDYGGDYHAEASTGPGRLDALKQLARKSDILRDLNRRLRDWRHAGAVRGLDIFHATNFLPQRPLDIPVLPLIHDVSHLRHPDWHPPERVDLLTRRESEFRQAALINTVSRFSATEIHQTLDIPEERIRVTSPGTNPVYFSEPVDAASDLRHLDLLPGRYFLSVGTLEPRKNLSTLLAAYIRLREREHIDIPLVVVGPAGWGDLKLPAGTDALRRGGHIRFPGYISERHMHALYAHAVAFLYPSLYEGFGMPVAEAMATGTRPVVAPGGATQEVAGDLGWCADPQEETAWRDAMRAALDEHWYNDTALRDRLAGRAAQFSWRDNADKTLAIYHELAAMAR